MLKKARMDAILAFFIIILPEIECYEALQIYHLVLQALNMNLLQRSRPRSQRLPYRPHGSLPDDAQ